jgi:hypothetical protein
LRIDFSSCTTCTVDLLLLGILGVPDVLISQDELVVKMIRVQVGRAFPHACSVRRDGKVFRWHRLSPFIDYEATLPSRRLFIELVCCLSLS